MGLKPDVSLTVALATGAVVWAIYNNAVPSMPDIRVGKPHDPDIDGSRKAAAYTAAGLVGGISLIAKDPTIFIVGGAMVIAADWWVRHANAHNPMVAGISPGGSAVALQDVHPDTTFMSGVPA
jgi:hypothetical protein